MKKILFIVIIIAISLSAQTKTKPRSHEEIIKKIYGKLEEKALSNGVNKPILKLGLEFVRQEKKSNRILIKKSEYPLTEMKASDFNPKNFKLSFYESKITIPLEIYSPDKKDIALLSTKIQSVTIRIELLVIPLNKKGKTYSFFTRVGEIYNNLEYFSPDGVKSKTKGFGLMHTKNDIELGLGESVKLDINDFNTEEWFVEDVIDGKKVKFESKKDYFDCFEDYLILTLESEGETSKNLNAETIKKMQKNAYQASKRSSNRDNIVATLTAIIADAQNYYWKVKSKKSFVGWKLPDTYQNLEIGTFSVEVYKESVKVTGIGKEAGNDRVNPIKVIMTAVPEKISSTSILN